jgi:hypothetical protein
MPLPENHATVWVCVDCYLTHHGYSRDELGHAPSHEPLSGLSDVEHVSAGLMWAEHECGRESWDDGDECECEHVTFSKTPCEGCGSPLAGSREALTIWWNSSTPSLTCGGLDNLRGNL